VHSRRGPYRITKRAIDVVLASLALVLLAPVIAVVALLIWLEDRSAPVFFRQQRSGLNGRRFTLLKFRTMVRDAEAMKEQLRARSQVTWPDFRVVNDPRVTGVGRVLRKTSLDELPQLINVLKGEMSVVGPRPTSFDVKTYELWQTERVEFRPGITGPWQVYGRNSMEFDERCRLEIRFFRSPSLLKETWLIVATIGSMVRRTGVA
jgi:lipopolysaccharide/colanic/teichoic acid biosynthesis glycosyltransferase